MTVDETAGSGARTAVVRGLAALGVTSLLLAAGLAGCTAIGNGSTATPAPAASSSSSPIAEEPQSPLAPYLGSSDPAAEEKKERERPGLGLVVGSACGGE